MSKGHPSREARFFGGGLWKSDDVGDIACNCRSIVWQNPLLATGTEKWGIPFWNATPARSHPCCDMLWSYLKYNSTSVLASQFSGSIQVTGGVDYKICLW